MTTAERAACSTSSIAAAISSVQTLLHLQAVARRHHDSRQLSTGQRFTPGGNVGDVGRPKNGSKMMLAQNCRARCPGPITNVLMRILEDGFANESRERLPVSARQPRHRGRDANRRAE